MQTYPKITYIISALMIIISLSPLSASAQSYRYRGGNESFGREVNEWRNRNSALQQKMQDLGTTAVTDLPIPVLFGVAVKNLTKNFGDARSGHTHEGLDIMAAEGMPVVSPTKAVVIRIGVGDSAGNYVSTANPGSESFVYMHLSKIADIDEGTELEPGDIIGYVGHTGNAVATAPHLHFEVHNENGDPTDPFPRLTTVFPIEDKIKYLKEILDNDADEPKELANLIVLKARSEVQSAKTANIELPTQIEKALVDNPVSVSSSSSSGSSTGTLKLGSKGPEVVTLQKFLIKKDVKSGGDITADGSFGPKTRQALIEYQASVGLTPDGVYGPKSKAYITSHS